MKIRDVKEGENIESFDFSSSSLKEGVCKRIFKRETDEALDIFLGKRKVTTTPEHAFFSSIDGRTKRAGDLIPGDILIVRNGSAVESAKITAIEKIKPEGFFYDIEVPGFENFIANGIVAHNSANRYQRIREGLLEDFLKSVGAAASEEFRKRKGLMGVIIGGPGPVKDDFLEAEYLNYEVKRQVLGTVNTSYTGEVGLREMVERAEDVISQASAVKESKLMERFFTDLAKDTGLAVYGERTLEMLKKGVVNIILISESYFKEHAEEVGSIIKEAENMGTKVEMISPDSPRGGQLKELGGLGGILRYKA